MGWQQGVKDVQIAVPPMTAYRSYDDQVVVDPQNDITEATQDEIEAFNEAINQTFHRLDSSNLRISVCKACNRYPKTVFKDMGICVGGTCFKRVFKGLLRSFNYAI